MTLRSSLSMAVIFNIILHVNSKEINEINQELVGSDALKQEAYFYKLLEMAQHENDHARHFLTVKKSLDLMGKSLPSTVYKRMKTNVLKSLHTEYLNRRAMYADEPLGARDDVDCSLNVIPVQVPYIPNGFSYPAFVNLQRCLGGCTFKSPSIIHCAAKDTSTVDVITLEFNLHTETFITKNLKMVNHTECDCECIVQEHHCDNATEIYNPDHCKCMCKDLEHTCDTTVKQWNTQQCRCACIQYPEPCYNEDKVWSEDTCDCQCRDYLTAICESKNQLLNPYTCQCQ